MARFRKTDYRKYMSMTKEDLENLRWNVRTSRHSTIYHARIIKQNEGYFESWGNNGRSAMFINTVEEYNRFQNESSVIYVDPDGRMDFRLATDVYKEKIGRFNLTSGMYKRFISGEGIQPAV